MKFKTTVHKYHRKDGTAVKQHKRNINVEMFKPEKKSESKSEDINTYGEKIDKDLVQKKLTPRKAEALHKEESKTSKEYSKMGLKSLAKDEKRHSEFFKREERDLRRVKGEAKTESKPRKSKDGYLHFKSKEDYEKWLAYGHIHGNFKKTPGNQKIKIAGKTHKVKHTKN